jgi:eukaryotic-like serine/threonine-protein kinase
MEDPFARNVIDSIGVTYFKRHNFSKEYEEMYSWVEDEGLRILFSTFHHDIIHYFSIMNNRLPVRGNDHYCAEESRNLSDAIETSLDLYYKLKDTEYSFDIDEYNMKLMKVCRGFLSTSGGSTLPNDMEKITLYQKIPIFISLNKVNVKKGVDSSSYQLKFINEGSYAFVYRYHDAYYDKDFALKRLKKSDDSNSVRFKREFEKMKELSSPHIAEVYCYNDDMKEYTMEFLECTLEKYMMENNSILSMDSRLDICFQILDAFEYLHSKDMFHRDISPRNIMIKKYDNDKIVIKITDFGFVKIKDSQLTTDTDVKGSYNDPSLHQDGFKNYSKEHEMYAITRVICFVLTGKDNFKNIGDSQIKDFAYKGMCADKTKRFSNIEDMRQALVKFTKLS